MQDRGTATEPPPRADFSATANQVCCMFRINSMCLLMTIIIKYMYMYMYGTFTVFTCRLYSETPLFQTSRDSLKCPD